MKRLLIAGTGTDVGKTFVTSALLVGLRNRGQAVVGLKPIESGYNDAGASDAEALFAASGSPVGLNWRPRYALAAPVSPHLAARQHGVNIEIEEVVRWVEFNTTAATAPPSEVALVESAGGLFSPLSAMTTNLDLIRRLEPCAWILVAPNRLGVLHDVGAAVRAARAEHRAPDILYLNRMGHDESTASNAAELRRLHPQLPVVTNPTALADLISGP